MNEILVLIDGNSLLNRAYYAIPPLNGADGKNTNAVFGFMNILFKALSEIKPTHMAIAFDKRGKTFRHELYPEYKANRKGMPDDLAQQMPMLFELLDEMGIRRLGETGVEGDDIIGTISKRFPAKTIIISGDRDLLQLVDESTDAWLTKKGISEVEQVTVKNIKQLYGLTPAQIAEFKALCGDASDNIPGVSGVGEKTALSLIERYCGIENIYANIGEIKGALQTKLLAGKDSAFLSKQLAEIKTDCQTDCVFEQCVIKPFPAKVRELFEKMQFRSLYKRLAEFSEGDGIIAVPERKAADRTVITGAAELNALVKQLSKQPLLAVYIDKNIYLAVSESEEFEVVITENLLDGLSFDAALEAVKPLLESAISKVVYDGKTFSHMMSGYGIAIRNVKYDISIMQYLVEYRAYKDFEALKTAYNVSSKASALLSLAKMLEQKLVADKTERLYFDVELPLSKVLFDMEQTGCKIDTEVLDSLHEKFSQECDALTKEAYELAGEKFNVLSSKQLAEILFNKLNLPAAKKTKTGFSTDSDVLEYLEDLHPLPKVILKIRKLSKLDSTYIEGMRSLIKSDGKIRTTFNQTLTATGRLSSSEPNLQNIPVRDEEGREIRKSFVPANDLLICADYSQIELRLLAHFSGDQNLIDAFNAGKDIHALVASEILGIPEEMVTPNLRRTAKAVNFGIIYGISNFGLAKNAGISPGKAKEYIRKYFASYPTIKNYLDGSIKFAKENGFVCTITGRRRQIPEIKSTNFQIRSFGERAAMNMPLQGSAADIIKIAMIGVYNALEKANLKSKLILQVHDELIVDAKENEQEQVVRILKKEMESAFKFKVKLDVKIEKGKNLYETK